MNIKYRKLIKNILIFGLGNFGSKFIIFILIPIFTTYLSAAEYGKCDLILTTVNIVFPILSISISESVFRFGISDTDNKLKILSCGLKFLCFVSFIPLIMGVAGLLWNIGKWFVLLCALIILFMFRNCLSLFLKAEGSNYAFAIDSVSYSLLLLILGYFLLAKCGLKENGFLLSYVISSTLSIGFLLAVGKINIKRVFKEDFDCILFVRMIRYSAPIVINSLSIYLITYTDKYMIKYIINDSEAGIYSIAAKIPGIVSVIVGIFNQAWLISSIDEYENERNIMFYKKIFSAFYTILALLSSSLIIIIKPFIKIYVSKEYFSSWRYVPFLIVATLFNSLATYFGVIYSSAYKNREVAKTTLIAGCLNFVLNYLLINFFGTIGAVVATLTADFAFFLIRLIDTRRFFTFPIVFNRMFLIFFVLLIECILYVFSNMSIVVYILFPTIIASICGREIMEFIIVVFSKIMK